MQRGHLARFYSIACRRPYMGTPATKANRVHRGDAWKGKHGQREDRYIQRPWQWDKRIGGSTLFETTLCNFFVWSCQDQLRRNYKVWRKEKQKPAECVRRCLRNTCLCGLQPWPFCLANRECQSWLTETSSFIGSWSFLWTSQPCIQKNERAMYFCPGKTSPRQKYTSFYSSFVSIKLRFMSNIARIRNFVCFSPCSVFLTLVSRLK